MLGNFLSCLKCVKVPLSLKWEGGISHETPQRKWASSGLERRTSWIFSIGGRLLSRYDGDVRDPIMWPQERPVSMPVVRVLSGSLSSRCRILRPRLESRLEPEVSSPVLTWILGFFWSLHRGFKHSIEWRLARPLSSRVVAAVSGFPSSCHSNLLLSLEAFPQGCHTCHRGVSLYSG